MRSPWGESSNYRTDNDDRSNGFDRGGGISHGLLGSLIERSTSAPPLSSEGLSFGEGSLFGREREREQSTMEPLYENRNREETFLARPQAGRASASPSYSKPDFTSLLQDGLGTDHSSTSRALDMDKGFDNNCFSRAGAELIRSQSAAPTFHGRSPLFPPPGLEDIKESQPTPSTVDSYSSSHSNSTHNFESAVDRGADIMKLGQRRPASTGVIGNGGLYSPAGAGGSLRPAAATFMDLIQEDDVPENGRNQGSRQGSFDSYHGDNRLRQTSPAMQRNIGGVGVGGEQQYIYTQHQQQHQPHQQQQQHQMQQHQYMQRADPHHDRMQHQQQQQHQQQGMLQHQQQGMRSIRDPYDMGAPMNDPMRSSQPQYVTLTDHGLQGEPRGQGSMYAPAGVHHGGHPMQRSMPPQPDAQRQIFYNGQQVDLQAPVITQSGQTVYLNAPGAPYGYATVQYHPHHQQPQIIRQSVPGRGHPHEQYVSVVPIQGGPAQLASIAGTGQAYAYWQPDGGGAPMAVPQVTIMNAAGPGGAPIAVARIGNPQMDVPHANNGYGGGRGKEKGGKGRRGGGIPSSRRGGGGGETKHSPHSLSSPLLEEFRATKSRDWTIRDIEGHVVEFCQDQNGSRFIQQRLEIGDATEQRVVMNEVLPAIHRLRNDVFGNYVVQKLLEFGTMQMKSDIRDTLQGEMLQLSLQMYGCRVVQKALETLDEDDLPRLLREFHHNVLSCIHDQNGNHVIQKCIEVMSNRAKRAREIGDDAKADFLGEQIDFVVDDILGNTASLSCHPYGCRVLQRILEHCVESKKTAALDEISKCHKTLLDDQYGNYVIQHVLQFGRQSDRESILHIVVENGLLSLSKQKFASNVVEKLLKYGTAQQRKAVVREMLKVVDDQTGAIRPAGSTGSSVVLLMVRDAYANYVVQTTLDVVPECEERRLLLEELNAHAAELRNYTFAKHIMTKLST